MKIYIRKKKYFIWKNQKNQKKIETTKFVIIQHRELKSFG